MAIGRLISKRVVAWFNRVSTITNGTSLDDITIAVKYFNPVGTGVWY